MCTPFMDDEREMTIHQRGLVDTCFEEGQYESGIEALDQLRSPSFKPPADHVRQLIYIALFPPPPPTTDNADPHQHFLPSLAKHSPTKLKPSLSRLSLSPSPLDSLTAQRVLLSFLATNSPGSLFRALPRYPLDDVDVDDELPLTSSDNSHDQDSPIARESLCIKHCRNCWAMLKDGFIQSKKLSSRKGRGRTTYDVEEAELVQSHGAIEPTVVAEHAWPILEWLLSLFEKDELRHAQNSGETFSPLLLSQIPPPRGGSGARWEAGAPLDIVFHAIDQSDGERRDMATRLLTLLINLSLSGSFDGPMFATTLTTRLYTCSPKIVQNLMEGLPRTIPVLTFKITTCQKFLSSSPSATAGTKPRPRPLPRRGVRRESGTTSMSMDADGQTGSSSVSRSMLATCSDIFQLLCSQHQSQKSASEPPVLSIKYVLLVSYAHLQGLLPPGEKNSDWKDALSHGGLKHVIDTAFPGGSMYHSALTIIASFWPAA